MKPELFVFVIWLGSRPMSALQLRCVASIGRFYPGFTFVTAWGDCPYPQPEDPQRASEILRRWILSQHEWALYADTDVELFGKLDFEHEDRPYFGAQDGALDEWLMYHKGQQAAFEELLRVPVIPPHYRIEGKEFYHHGATMNAPKGEEDAS